MNTELPATQAVQAESTTVEPAPAKLKKTRQKSLFGPSEIEKFVVRLPAGLRDQIKQLSDQNRRSMNCEIVNVLEGYIRHQLVQQMTEIHGDATTSTSAPRSRRTDVELKHRLDKLPKEKKAALLELLG